MATYEEAMQDYKEWFDSGKGRRVAPVNKTYVWEVPKDWGVKKMGLIVSDSGEGFTVPADTHPARLVMVADLGTQDGPYGAKHQVLLGFELPTVLHVFDEERGEEPAMLSRFFTASLNEKARLREFLEGWRGRAFTEQELAGFDLFAIAGQPCLLKVIHSQNQKGQTRATIKSVTRLPKGMEIPDQVMPEMTFTFADPSVDAFRALPNFVQKIIAESSEWKQFAGENKEALDVTLETVASDEESDGVPF